MMRIVWIVVGLSLVSCVSVLAYDWGAPRAPVVPQADGYYLVPGAALVPQRSVTYKAVFDATRGADKPSQLLPALDMAGSELNLLAGVGVPVSNAKFVVVFHGDAIDGILNERAYRAKHQVTNPNLPVLAQMRRHGVELYVCGQNLAFEGIDPAAITPEVRVASDALIALMTYQMKGYALLSF